jgi:hypothetical protein
MATKSVRILDMLEQAGDNGMEFGEIQEALWLMSHSTPFTREVRGYWCTNLCYRPGLLKVFATKGPDGLWRRNTTPHNGHPWSVVRAWSEEQYRIQEAARRARHG